MLKHAEISQIELHSLIKNQKILLGGNKRLKIYGKLSCKSGKKMKKENRVFFGSEEEALAVGYRPCARCMRVQYLKWKSTNSK